MPAKNGRSDCFDCIIRATTFLAKGKFMKRKSSPMMSSRRKFLAGTGAVAAGLTFAPYKSFSAEEKRMPDISQPDGYCPIGTYWDPKQERCVPFEGKAK